MTTPSDEIKSSLTHKILIGQYPIGSTLPSCRELAVELGINRNTASKIYRQMAREGLVKSVRGRGVVVISQRRAEASPVPGVRRHILAAAREAKLLGMAREAFLQAVGDVANELYVRERPTIAFVECNQADAEILAREIQSDIAFPVQPVLLPAVERSPQTAMAGYDIVCTTLYHFLSVSEAMGKTADKLVAVHAPPDPDALLDIARLGAETRIGVVCAQAATQQYLASAIGMVHHGEIHTYLLTDQAAVRGLRGAVDVIVDVPSCHDEVTELFPDMPTVTIGFRIDAKSLIPLRERLARQQSPV